DFDGRINGGHVQLWDCSGGPNQQWRRQPLDGGWGPRPTPSEPVSLTTQNGKCLAVPPQELEQRQNGTRVVAWDCSGRPHQQWRLQGAAVMATNGKCLDVNGAEFDSRANGGRVQLWDCHGGP